MAGRRPPNIPRVVGFSALGALLLAAAIAVASYVPRFWVTGKWGNVVYFSIVALMLTCWSMACLSGPFMLYFDARKEARRKSRRK